MAVIVQRNTLTQEQKIALNKDLTILIEKEDSKYNDSTLVQFYFTTPETVKLPLFYACSNLGENNDDYGHPTPKDLTFTGELRDYQVNITNNIISRLSDYRGATLIASTGAGKTIIGAWTAAKLECHTVILIEKIPLITQWKETIQQFTNGKVWVVGDEEAEDEEEIPEFIICMKERAKKVPEKIRKAVGLVIIDEAHKFCTKHSIETLMYFTPLYTLSLTATPNRTDKAQKIIHHISGDDYIKYAEKKTIQVIRVNTEFEYGRPVTERGELDWNKIDEELHMHPLRNQYLLNLLMYSMTNGRKVLVLTRRVEHVKMLSKALTHYKIVHDTMYGSKKSYRDSPILIGSVMKIGEGYDEATACPDFGGKRIDTVIIFNSYKSLMQLEQNIGRSRDKFPVIYHFVDKDKIIYGHWLKLRKFYTAKDNASEVVFQTIKGEEIGKDAGDDGNEIFWPYDSNREWILNDSVEITKEKDSSEEDDLEKNA
jgi:late competence protein required for DNA uptake (superfamily II DNA/RNA helicase)